MAGPKHSAARRLTPKSIEALRPADERYDVSDGNSGLVLRVHPSGTRSFRWQVRSLNRVIVLGPWAATLTPAHLTLREARDWLERLKEARVAGEAQLDRVVEALRRHVDPPKEDPHSAERRTFKVVAEEWYRDDIEKNRKRPEDARRILDVDLLPVLGARALDAITTLDCRGTIKRVVDRGAPVHAGKVLAQLKQFFGWAQSNGFTDRNPAFPLKGRHIGVEVNTSDRWLTAEEIPIFWRALEAGAAVRQVERPDPRTGKAQVYTQAVPTMAPATAAAMRLLLLTAARTGELLRARWEHVDLKGATWTIPVENQKLTKTQERRARPFVIPLPPTAVELFTELQRLAAHVRVGGKPSPWVMAGTGETGRYDEKSFGHALRRLFATKALVLPGGPITPHDLRRTARTHLGKLRVPLHIVERCLNHSLGRIVQTYDVGDYLEERREALEKWAAYVGRLVAPAARNVIPLVSGGAL
jgi:integrase